MSELHFIPEEPTPLPRRGIRLTTLMVGVLVVGGLLGLSFRHVHEAREAARYSQCASNLKQFGLAFHNYHATWGSFPPAYTTDATGKPMHSWRVLILPYLEQSALYESYNMAEPWDGPNNRKLLDQRPNIYGCPSRDAGRTLASYAAIVGPKTAFPGSKSRSIGEISDGTSRTILLVEVSNVDIPWTEPRDLDAATMSWVTNDPSRPGISSPHDCSPVILLADGMVRYRRKLIPPEMLKSLATADGGEAVDLD